MKYRLLRRARFTQKGRLQNEWIYKDPALLCIIKEHEF